MSSYLLRTGWVQDGLGGKVIEVYILKEGTHTLNEGKDGRLGGFRMDMFLFFRGGGGKVLYIRRKDTNC